jgi:ubiquinone/menaquinone biosynthesis C-methylase UbiE
MSWKIFDSSFIQYDNWFDSDGKTVFENELKALQLISPDESLKSIEIGSGTGRFSKGLKIGFGIEPSFNMAKTSKKKGVSVIVAKGEELPIKDNSFEMVFFIFSLCFIDNANKALDEAYRILQKKGKIIIGFVPSESNLGKKYIQKKKEGHPYYKHSVFFSYIELKQMITKKGFKIIDNVFHLLSDEKISEIPSQGVNQKANFLIIKAEKK